MNNWNINNICSAITRIRKGSNTAFPKGGEKNFDGTITALQMQTYIVTKDLRKRIRKDGTEYGWSVSVYATPESIWGRKVTSAYKEDPEKSMERIYRQMKKLYPDAEDRDIRKAIG